MSKDEAKAALRAIMGAIVDTVKDAGPMGAPSSALYMALQEQGCRLETYTAIMGALVSSGQIRKIGDCYVAR